MRTNILSGTNHSQLSFTSEVAPNASFALIVERLLQCQSKDYRLGRSVLVSPNLRVINLSRAICFSLRTFSKNKWRFRQRFLREIKRSPVHADGLLRLHILVNHHCFKRIEMHGFHKPAGHVTANGYQGKAHGTESLADFFEIDGISRISGKKYVSRRCGQHPTAPQNRIGIKWRAHGKMLRRHAMKSDRSQRG